MGLFGSYVTILSSFSFSESNIYADLLLVSYIGIPLPPPINLVAKLGLMAGVSLGLFLALYWMCEAFSAFISKSRLWSTD